MSDGTAQPPEKPKGYVVLREAQPMKPTPVSPPPSPAKDDPAKEPSLAWLYVVIPLGIILIIISPVLLFFADIFLHGLNFGRPFRVRRRTLAAPVAPSGSWTAPMAMDVENLDAATRHALGAAWLADARAEHASVAAFGRLSLELLAVGTPPQLLAAAHQAALEEIQHARLCFSLAASYTPQQLGAGPFPEAAIADPRRWPQDRTQQLILLATEALRDGCLGEGAGAAVLAEAAAAAAAPIQAQLSQVAKEEQRHAELSWSLLEYCLAAGDPRVRRAVERTLASLRPEISAPKPPTCDEALWRAHGRPTPAQVTRCYHQTLLAVRQRTTKMLSKLDT